MTKLIHFIVLFSVFVGLAAAQQATNAGSAVVHVMTALNHLTVLEFHEPVTMAASGSAEFQIEREANKVFIKPTKSGAATDLFVWTASKRFAYELETTEEVKNMNFAIDSGPPAMVPKTVVPAPTDEIADIVLTRALLDAEEIHQAHIRPVKNRVHVRVEQVFRTRSTLYVQYRIENSTNHLYRVAKPRICQLRIDEGSLSPSLTHSQLDPSALERLGNTEELPLSIAHTESESQELGPGEATQGVIVIRRDLKSPAVVQLEFDDEVKAIVVL